MTIDLQNLKIAQPICIIVADPANISVEYSYIRAITRQHFAVWCQGFKNQVLFNVSTGYVTGQYDKIIKVADPQFLNSTIENLQISQNLKNAKITIKRQPNKIPVKINGQLVFRRVYYYQGQQYIGYQKSKRRVENVGNIYRLANHV